MRTSSRRLATAVLAISLLALFVPSAIYAQGSAQTISFAGADFNSTEPTITALAPAAQPQWSAVVFTAHEFYNLTSALTVDFISSSSPATLAKSTAAPIAYTQSDGWFQYLRVQMFENGHAYVYYLQNSSAGTPLEIFSCSACWYANQTTLGSLSGAAGHEANINYGQEVFVTISSDSLYVGAINSTTGALQYWVNGFGLTSVGLGGGWYVGETLNGGLTDLGAATGSYKIPAVSAGVAYPCMMTGIGYVQVEIDPPGFTTTQTITSMIGIVYQIIPLFILLAVMGLIVNVFKSFKV
jgi:hypothetical protein